MLFHVEQTHSPENCPYGQGGSRSLHDASAAGVEVKGVYGAFTEHVVLPCSSRPTTSTCLAPVPGARHEDLLGADNAGQRPLHAGRGDLDLRFTDRSVWY